MTHAWLEPERSWAVFEALEPPLRRFLLARCHNLVQVSEHSGRALDDLIAEVREDYMASLAAEPPGRSQTPGATLRWLETVAVHRLVDTWRAVRRRPATQSLDARQDDESALLDRLAGDTDTEWDALRDLTLRHVWQVAEEVFLGCPAAPSEVARLQQIAMKMVLLDGHPPEAALRAVARPPRVAAGRLPATCLNWADFICDPAAARRVAVYETLHGWAPGSDPEAALSWGAIARRGKRTLAAIAANWPRCCGERPFAPAELCNPHLLRYLALRLYLLGVEQQDICRALADIAADAGLRCTPAAINNWLSYSHGSSAWARLVSALLHDSFDALLSDLVDLVWREEETTLERELGLAQAHVSPDELRQWLALHYRSRLDEYPFQSPDQRRDALRLVTAAHRLLVRAVTSRLAEHIGRRSDAGTRRP